VTSASNAGKCTALTLEAFEELTRYLALIRSASLGRRSTGRCNLPSHGHI
jgi:hypothetical protein